MSAVEVSMSVLCVRAWVLSLKFAGVRRAGCSVCLADALASGSRVTGSPAEVEKCARGHQCDGALAGSRWLTL